MSFIVLGTLRGRAVRSGKEKPRQRTTARQTQPT